MMVILVLSLNKLRALDCDFWSFQRSLVRLSLCSFLIASPPPWLSALQVVETKPFAEPLGIPLWTALFRREEWRFSSPTETFGAPSSPSPCAAQDALVANDQTWPLVDSEWKGDLLARSQVVQSLQEAGEPHSEQAEIQRGWDGWTQSQHQAPEESG